MTRLQIVDVTGFMIVNDSLNTTGYHTYDETVKYECAKKKRYTARQQSPPFNCTTTITYIQIVESIRINKQIEEKEKYIEKMEETYKENIERTLSTIGNNLVQNENELLETRNQIMKMKKYAKKLEDKLKSLGYNIIKK